MRKTVLAFTLIFGMSLMFGVQFVEVVESQSIFYDSFDSATLSSDYEIVNSEGVTFDLSTNLGWLRISLTSPGDRVLSESVFNASMVLMQGIRGDFTVMTRVNATMNQGEVSAGIVILDNSKNFLKFEKLHSLSPVGYSFEEVPYYTGVRFEDGYGWDSFFSRADMSPTFLKIVREDDVFTAYYDYTGFPLIFNVDGPVDVGLYITSVGYNGTFSADFDYFIIQEKSTTSLTPTPSPEPTIPTSPTPLPSEEPQPSEQEVILGVALTLAVSLAGLGLLFYKIKSKRRDCE